MKAIKEVVREGLETLVAEVPRGKGFPFDLPAVEWVAKVYQAREFLKELERIKTRIRNVTDHDDHDQLERLQSALEQMKNTMDAYLTPETLALVRKLRTSAGKFAQLRQILADKEATGKQIKQRIKLYKKHLKNQLPAHPEYNEILTRLNNYSSGLYHGYDDPRIPLTNLDQERFFKAGKRFNRRRTGTKERKNQFVLEAEEFYTGVHYRTENQDLDSSPAKYIDMFKKKRLLLSNSEIRDLFKKSQARKKTLHRKYLWKPSTKKTTAIYHRLKEKLRSIS